MNSSSIIISNAKILIKKVPQTGGPLLGFTNIICKFFVLDMIEYVSSNPHYSYNGPQTPSKQYLCILIVQGINYHYGLRVFFSYHYVMHDSQATLNTMFSISCSDNCYSKQSNGLQNRAHGRTILMPPSNFLLIPIIVQISYVHSCIILSVHYIHPYKPPKFILSPLFYAI